MAKQKNEALADNQSDFGQSVQGQTAVLEAPPKASPKWKVALKCPTPLLHEEMVIEATGPEQAKAIFMDTNGICATVHEWEVQRVA
jgi:hypothetical protein